MSSTTRADRQSFRALIDSITEVRWENLPASKLYELHAAMAVRQDALRDRAAEIRAALDEDLRRNDVAAFEKHHQQVRRLECHYNWLEASKRRIFNIRQRVIVRDGMRSVLGSRGCAIVEHAVLYLILVVLAILLYEMYHDYVLPEKVVWTLFAIDAAICSVFIGEFFLRLSKAEDRKWFWKSNWIDLASSIPIPPFWLGVLDLNTFGRTLRLVRILRVWRAFRILSFMWRGMERLQQVTDVRLMRKSLLWAIGIILAGAIGIHYIEGQNDAHVASLPHSLWWSFNTVATGGFGDLYEPKGILAQLITAALVIAGLVVMGVFIATLAAAYRGESPADIQLGELDASGEVEGLVGTRVHARERQDAIDQDLVMISAANRGLAASERSARNAA